MNKLQQEKVAASKVLKVSPDIVPLAISRMLAAGLYTPTEAIVKFYGVTHPDHIPDYRKEARWEGESDTFLLFEGLNPNNPEHDVVMYRIGGTPSFLKEWEGWEEDCPWGETTKWNMDTDTGEGSIEFLDPLTGETFYIERFLTGDWS